DDTPIVVVLQHPTTTRPSEAGEQMARTLDAVRSVDCYPFIIYPNSDFGSREIIGEIHSAAESWEAVSVYKNVSRSEFLGLLNVCDALVGNSSSGLIEAPSLDVPVVNVGPRQQGRERADNVIDVPHEREAIERALRTALFDEAFIQRVRACDNPFYLDGAAEQIYAHLRDVDIGRDLLEKSTEL
ncbi:MAG: UDP-N-acetylglucosamine 2-epimerase, partial [Natronomonas sp.]|uniref:UDP-N-acetylglucosamine 2-epimerase n=1 Tax=Natronomonas sp. TaxID=2184060 RepID=UPI0028708DCB